MNAPDGPSYPRGLSLALDADTRVLADGVVFGGSPARVLRLSERGREAWSEIVDGPVRTAAGARLARRLTDVGVLHPVPESGARLDVTVVVPVRDRPAELDRCLAALGGVHSVIVVDDASREPALIEAVCTNRGATLLSQLVNGGPGAARNHGVAEVDTEFVLFLDSDCVPPPDLVQRLAGAFTDPLVAAVAPRIEALPGSSAATRYGAMAGSLDLGTRPARVRAGTRVSYVPTAALLVRRSALEQIGGFDIALHVGEDVDLVWRLDAAGWRVRYEPSVSVAHAEPDTWRALLVRRFRYGTSAGPLARRHPGRLTPLVVHRWSGLAVLAVLARRPLLALAALAGSTATLRTTLRKADLDADGAPTQAARAAWQTWCGAGRAATQFASPLLAAAMLRRGCRSRRLIIAAFVLSAPAADWLAGRRTMGAVGYTAARVADDAAYGAGVIAGSVRHRTAGPLRVVFVHRMLRLAPTTERSPHA